METGTFKSGKKFWGPGWLFQECLVKTQSGNQIHYPFWKFGIGAPDYAIMNTFKVWF